MLKTVLHCFSLSAARCRRRCGKQLLTTERAEMLSGGVPEEPEKSNDFSMLRLLIILSSLYDMGKEHGNSRGEGREGGLLDHSSKYHHNGGAKASGTTAPSPSPPPPAPGELLGFLSAVGNMSQQHRDVAPPSIPLHRCLMSPYLLLSRHPETL